MKSDDKPAKGLYVKGYLVTLRDGYEVRMGPDRARADHYAAQNHGIVEPMFVIRRGPDRDR